MRSPRPEHAAGGSAPLLLAPHEIRTPRLRLRPLALSDAAAISAFTADPGVARMTSSMPCPNPEAAVKGWIFLTLARAGLGLDRVYAIEAGGPGLIGVLGLHARARGVALGYWLGRPAWGKGYATEAVQAAVRMAGALGLPGLVATHFLDNPASGRVLEKAGFAPNGAEPLIYSLARAGSAPGRELRLDFNAQA